jgi:hypothetical protein
MKGADNVEDGNGSERNKKTQKGRKKRLLVKGVRRRRTLGIYLQSKRELTPKKKASCFIPIDKAND